MSSMRSFCDMAWKELSVLQLSAENKKEEQLEARLISPDCSTQQKVEEQKVSFHSNQICQLRNPQRQYQGPFLKARFLQTVFGRFSWHQRPLDRGVNDYPELQSILFYFPREIARNTDCAKPGLLEGDRNTAKSVIVAIPSSFSPSTTGSLCI